MAHLENAFRLPESRVEKAIVVIDINNSTAMKESNSEAFWLSTFGWFFDLLGKTMLAHNGKGQIVKYLGDGLMAVFDSSYVADAVNWAIQVQEAIIDANVNRTISCTCSIGISYGRVVEFDSEEGRKDYIGSGVDRAFRLCSAANAKAIFVDTHTCDAAQLNNVSSRVGAVCDPPRTVDGYKGEQQKVSLKGFAHVVDYYEIRWASDVFGVSKSFVTDASQPELRAPEVKADERTSIVQPVRSASEWVRGSVTKYTGQFGFIRSRSDQDFYFSSEYLFMPVQNINLGDVAYFIPAEPLKNAPNSRAYHVVILGMKLKGHLIRPVSDQGFGFVLCKTHLGEVRQIFVFFGSNKYPAGTVVEFQTSENKRGLSGANPEMLEPAAE
jgi:class 3 adenylate cyclase